MASEMGAMPVVGAQVSSVDGDDLGTVQEVNGQCFKITAAMSPDGWLGSDCITGSSTGGVRVNLTRGQLGEAPTTNADHGAAHQGYHRHDPGTAIF
jgi:hypothetical protein